MPENNSCPLSQGSSNSSSFVFGLILGAVLGAVIAVILYKNNKITVFDSLQEKLKAYFIPKSVPKKK